MSDVPVPPLPGAGRNRALAYLRECVAQAGCETAWWLYDPVSKSGSVTCLGAPIGFAQAIAFFCAIDPDVCEVEVEGNGAYGRIVSRWTVSGAGAGAARSPADLAGADRPTVH